MPRFYRNPETGHWDLTEEEYFRLKEEESKHSKKYEEIEFHLKGGGFPSKSIKSQNKLRKALEKNPNHTSMEDYKFSNPNSLPNKARKKSKKKLKQKGIEVKSKGYDHG